MKKQGSKLKKIAAILLSFAAPVSFACTDIKVTAQDGTVVIARSMEFAVDLKSNLMTAPRNTAFNMIAPNGKSALSWKNQYGYVFLDGLGSGMAVDGMNEQGLSVEALYLPGETQYQTVPQGHENQTLPYLRLGDWILGNFKTIDEVKKSLSKVYVVAEKIPEAKDYIFPLHFSVYDKTGKGIVIEFIKGKMQISDNHTGVMTNSPRYEWQTTNLRNYVNLSPTNPKPVIDDGITYAATGQGAGMVGLPGDVSPPSRFVKMAIMLKTILPPSNAEEAVNMAQHIINNVDIPRGFVREKQNLNTATNETTQWVVFKDLKNGIFYYRTYGDLALHAVNLSKVNLAENAPQLKMPIYSKPSIVDMTSAFLKNNRQS